jgi:hypothetical protein
MGYGGTVLIPRSPDGENTYIYIKNNNKSIYKENEKNISSTD